MAFYTKESRRRERAWRSWNLKAYSTWVLGSWCFDFLFLSSNRSCMHNPDVWQDRAVPIQETCEGFVLFLNIFHSRY